MKQVTFDILRQEVKPETHRFSQLNLLYIELIEKMSNSSGAHFERLTDAVVIFKFDVEYQKKYHYFERAMGNPFVCDVELTSELGRKYRVQLGCNIRLHDPNREYRRENF